MVTQERLLQIQKALKINPSRQLLVIFSNELGIPVREGRTPKKAMQLNWELREKVKELLDS